MKSATLLAAGCLLALPAAAATYECTDSQGRRTYTATPGPNCKDANLGKPSIYTSVQPAPENAGTAAQTSASVTVLSAEPENIAPSSPAAIRAAEERLRQAKQNLEEGRKVRHGNERNYARYLERIKGLEDAVAAAQKELDGLKRR
ncbi:MAG: DUF4124 domain-containing protein [Eikenella sp.]|nr:DUF4124 domain-containing protein [Eikenella sp.]